MSTKSILSNLNRLRDELVEQRMSPNWALQRRLVVQAMTICRMQLDYDKNKAKTGIYVAFFDGSKPFTERDLGNIKEAVAVNGEIRKHLSAIKKAKMLTSGGQK